MDAGEKKRLLREFIAAHRADGHAFGANDCALFAAAWVALVAGVDPAADLRGTYSTEAEADALTAALGGFDQAVPDRLTAVGIEPVWFDGGLNARSGDLLIGDLPTGYDGDGRPGRVRRCLAIANGQHGVSPSDGGLAIYSLDRFIGGWRV